MAPSVERSFIWLSHTTQTWLTSFWFPSGTRCKRGGYHLVPALKELQRVGFHLISLPSPPDCRTWGSKKNGHRLRAFQLGVSFFKLDLPEMCSCWLSFTTPPPKKKKKRFPVSFFVFFKRGAHMQREYLIYYPRRGDAPRTERWLALGDLIPTDHGVHEAQDVLSGRIPPIDTLDTKVEDAKKNKKTADLRPINSPN